MFYEEERDEEIVTIFTTFVDSTDLHNSQYRSLVQLNFLRMTNYECFQDKINFIVFTQSKDTKLFIEKEYPHILVLYTPLRGNFTSPMLKDLFRMSLIAKRSFFFMFANADNLYDSSLIKTLSAVRRAWLSGQIRQKLIIYGQRNNIVINNGIFHEDQFLEYFQKSISFSEAAQDYFIVTRDSIEWELYPEVIVGRRAFDNMLVDFGVRSELESIDASISIRLLHQTEKNTNYSSLDKKNIIENRWNLRLSALQGEHYSTTCARYTTEYNGLHNDVIINDKKSGSILTSNTLPLHQFNKEHDYWINHLSQESGNIIITQSPPILYIIILTYNKPDSLDRLLNSLLHIDNTNLRIDIIISIDRGNTGYYDVPTLAISNRYIWGFGKKRVVLKQTHTGQLYQWLEAIDFVNDNQSFVLILEDSVVLARNWFNYVMSVLRHRKVESLYDRVAGWTLETPLVTSIALAEMKRVRSFILIRSVWKLFLDWFKSESRNVSKHELSKTFVSRLENRGSYTNWESGLWITWYSYWISENFLRLNRFAYIINKSGNLCVELYTTFVKDWDKRNENCYGNQVLRNVVIVPSSLQIEDHTIMIPDRVPTYKIDVARHN
ncbi:hypothetical protein LOD99_2340 [Oopsacas minuta]|uniref:Uncharacterized protein n=1 Tax=Oopsacas minuta TaxID=111878 RepID=A0AAV7K2C5_9METZ|nr:hypothetical protein LOD99_2340 [Oopsacas minuta]